MTEFNYAQIEEAILGGTTQRRGDTVIVRGEGSWLFDTAGRRYLDLTAAQGVAMVGHCHPKLSAALAAQAHQLIALPNFLYNETRARFAAELAKVLPAHLNHVFLANSGAEAVDGAIKFARLTTGRTGLVATMRGFHGRTVGAVSVTWEPKYRKPFEPLLDVTHVPYNNLAKLADAVTDQTAMVILEVVQGEGGVNMGDGAYLRGAQALCRERGALLVLDEIQTGFGRTGKWFGFQHFDLQPDIICMAKGIGGGFPMGALAYTEQVHAVLSPGAHGSTFGGSPIACAAGLAALQIYHEEGLIERSAQMGALLLKRLQETIGDYEIVREIRGLGLMIAVELREKVGPYLKTLMEEHSVLALPAGTNVLRLLPPLTLSAEEIEIGVAAIAAALPNH
ncbi:MAG: aminotransferase class III-fold pyridoxal phosphate-dependent enzyme [Caldilinea sp. CFX5]|nr:aminotransferase class III-fold pyridoxal phosphate-dependent enzyme [Caldilinea sp. CFX5]